MIRARRAGFGVASAALCASLGLAGNASAQGPAEPSKAECVAAYEQTQSMRKDGQLVSAKAKALYCAQGGCPEVVKTDCARWLGEIEGSIPTVTFAVVGPDGAETSAVRVEVDGKPFAAELDGKARPIDPGSRTFTVTLADGSDAREVSVIVREGEKNRLIEVSFAPDAPPAPGVAPVGATPSRPDEGGGDGGIPAATIILGGVGIVGIGLFATFALLGTSDKSELEDTCAPSCPEEDVDDIRTKLLIADISLGVGVASLAAAVIVWAVSGDDGGSERVSLDVGPREGGGFATVRGRF